MAVSFVGAGTAVLGIDALSVPWPGSQSAGDIGLLLLETNETDTVSVSGVTELASSPQYHVSQAHKLSVFWVEATGSDANISIPDPGNHGIAQILVFSGVDTTAPINVTVGTSPGVNSTSVTCTGVTTTSDGCAVIHIVGTSRDGNTTAQFDSWSNANLVSLTEIADVTTGAAGGGGFGAAWGIKTTAGVSGDCTVTQAVAAIYTTITVALEPASGGGGIITASFAGINLASGSGSTSKLAAASAAGSTHAVGQSSTAKIASGVVQGATLTLCDITSGKVSSAAATAYAPCYGVAVGSKIAPGIVNTSAEGYAPMFTASGGAKISAATLAAATLSLGSSIAAKIAAGSSANHLPLLGIATGSKIAPGVVDASGSGYAPQFVAAASHKIISASASAYAPVTAAVSGSKYGAGSLAGWFGPSLSVATGAPYVPGAVVTGERIDLQSPITTNIALASRITRRVELASYIN